MSVEVFMTDNNLQSTNLRGDELERMMKFRDWVTEFMIAEHRRRGRPVSQAEIAAQMGLGATALSQYINLRRVVSPDAVMDIVIATGYIAPAEIMGYDDKFRKLASNLIESDGLRYLFDNWSKLNEQERKELLDSLRDAAEANSSKGDNNHDDARTPTRSKQEG